MVGWEFEVINRLNILNYVKRRMLLIYTFGAGFGFLQVISDLSDWGIHLISLPVAAGLIIFFTLLVFAVFFPMYRRLTSVRIQQDGIRYGSRNIIAWNEMTDVTFIWEDNLPYLSVKKRSDPFGEFHIPLYLHHFESFKNKLRDMIPKGHDLEMLMPEIEELNLGKIPSRVKWWHI